MAYTELVKNFQRIRDYMREFYIYGFKSREEYEQKSPRSYDNERRRIESYLGEYMAFRQTPAGKNVFLSIDSRSSVHNPLYKALKSKSFTDGEITLHFILFDILHSPEIALPINEIMTKLDADYLSTFKVPLTFDESTVRKKLKEYIEIGIITTKKAGRQTMYSRTENPDLSPWKDALDFFSEAGLCGIVGSFLLDKLANTNEHFSFKHHYIMHALDSEVLCALLKAMTEKNSVIIHNITHRSGEKTYEIVPLRIFVSAQNGRRYLLGYNLRYHVFKAFRLDYIINVQASNPAEHFDELRQQLNVMQKHMWGVLCNKRSALEHVEFTVHIGDNEEHIYQRLVREKRCGTVQRLDKNTCRFSAEVFDSSELIPWIRTFICRILFMNFSNRNVENQFKKDIEDMYQLYDLGGDVL